MQAGIKVTLRKKPYSTSKAEPTTVTQHHAPKRPRTSANASFVNSSSLIADDAAPASDNHSLLNVTCSGDAATHIRPQHAVQIQSYYKRASQRIHASPLHTRPSKLGPNPRSSNPHPHLQCSLSERQVRPPQRLQRLAAVRAVEQRLLQRVTEAHRVDVEAAVQALGCRWGDARLGL